MLRHSAKAFGYVGVSVGDMATALDLWVGRFGMQLVRRREGDDAELAAVWDLPAGAIADQALLETPGAARGGLHLVRFTTPGEPVRAGATATDLVPKSIDVEVRDIQARHAELVAAGHEFRSKIGRLETDGRLLFEVHMPAHDRLNVVLLEEPADPAPVSPRGYAVAPQIVLVTPDNPRESAFFQALLDLETISHHHFTGPEIERVVGLPAGAGLDITILGDPRVRFGRLELVQYEGVRSRNLYPRAVPPARGMLSVTYAVPDLEPVIGRGRALGMREHGRVRSILGESRMASVTSPAGLRVDIIEG